MSWMITNPAHSSRILHVTLTLPDGREKKVVVNPGSQLQVDRPDARIRSVPRPSRLVRMADGTYDHDAGEPVRMRRVPR